MGTREVQSSVIIDGARWEVWDLLTTVPGVTSWLAPAAQIHAAEGGEWRLAFDAAGKRCIDGGVITRFARDQELMIAFEAPEALTTLKRATTRLTWAIEPLDVDRQRVVLAHTGFGEGGEWERFLEHCQSAWEPVLERLRRRTVLYAPSIDQYEPFWAGL